MPVYLEKARSNKIPITPYSLYLWSSGYDTLFTERVKLFPIKSYDPKTKKWELPLHEMARILKNFKGLIIKGTIDEYTQKRFENIDKYIEYLAKLEPSVPFDFKTNPDPHQIEWFNEMLNRNRVILGDPMGLGKTKEYLDVAEYRRNNGYKKLLFICKSKHKWNMVKEIKTHTDGSYIVIDDDYTNRIESLRDYYMKDDLYYLIISYEMAAAHADQLKIIGNDIGFDGIIMDEFNKIKNWESRGRGRKDGKSHLTVQITNLAECLNPELMILGSGTPITKRPTDIYAPLRLVGVEKRSHDEFRRQYCKTDTFGNIIGTQNEQELSDKLWSVMIRRPKELLRLPEPRISYIPLRMPKEQRMLYDACRLQIKKELRGTKAYGANQLSRLTRLRQITTSPYLVDSDAPSIKEEVLKEYIEDIIETGEKAIIYSVYREETLRLADIFSHYKPAYVDGTMNARNAQSEVDRFQTEGNCYLFIGSLFACMECYTLTAASHEFFLDQSWTVTDNEQAMARAHRRGQDKIVNVWKFYCENTIDERVMEIHAEDSAMISEIVEGSGVIFTPKLVDRLLA